MVKQNHLEDDKANYLSRIVDNSKAGKCDVDVYLGKEMRA